MWNRDKQSRLDELRQLESSGSLSQEDMQTLQQLLDELEAQEWSALRPALTNLRQESGELGAGIAHLSAQNAALYVLAEQYADLIARARMQLAILTTEHEVLRTQYDRVLQP